MKRYFLVVYMYQTDSNTWGTGNRWTITEDLYINFDKFVSDERMYYRNFRDIVIINVLEVNKNEYIAATSPIK